ncbi:unnamed protein product [Lymnaea stagnalis]|uniref:FAM194 C-terminal domain-containing protein n=1 Tax=Lymnaea stagnalis TaxID=6523 RepID=A0AAV2HM56_LYMST
MDSDYFFYEQRRIRPFSKRFKKLPEDLPDSLKFAHLNPKVAALLASKEKQKQEEDVFGDGFGKKSLMPEISQAFNALKNHLDSSLNNDEDSQRFLFEEARINSGNVLLQLSRIIYYYDNIASLIPKSLECQMMSGYTDLTADVHVIYREWQTQASKEAFLKKLSETPNGEEPGKASPSIMEEGRSTRSQSLASESGRGNKKRLLAKSGTGLPEIIEDTEALFDPGRQNIKRNDSRMSGQSRRSGGRSKPYDIKGTSAMANSNYYMSVIQFQLSSKACQDKAFKQLIKNGRVNWLSGIIRKMLYNFRRPKKKEQKLHELQIGYSTIPSVRYYGDTRKEALLKYRKSPVKTSSNNPMREGKPRIPLVFDDDNEGRQSMLTTHPDGTTVAYYLSGRPAVVASASGIHRTGFYTIVYDDDVAMTMLALFTPSGQGVCYHTNGIVRFLSTIKGGHLANKDGKVIRHWKWPQAQVKLTTPVQFQMNQCLGLRCVAENYIVILFSCQKESARFFVNVTPGIKEKKSDENNRLLTNFTFTSKAAKNILRMYAPKKSKSKRKKEKLSKQLAELVKAVDIQDKLLYDLEADKDLARLQRKARNLIDDWLEHYRVTIGLKSPTLVQLNESPSKSRLGAYSAKVTEGREDRKTTFGFTVRDSVISARIPSAPSGATMFKPRETIAEDSQAIPNSNPTVRFDQNLLKPEVEIVGSEEDGETKLLTSGAGEKFNQVMQNVLRSKSADSRKKSGAPRQQTAVSLPDKESLPANISLCPVALHMQMASDPRPHCRCSRHSIPYISDLEYDKYITEGAPSNQLQIIVIVSSLYPQGNHTEDMLNEIYQNQNRNRTRPCLQCRGDPFRLLKYDINTATEGSDHTQPLLLTRHNVVPGMFLIYAEGHLLFCDHIFNGYGNARKDFQKQVLKSKLDFTHGLSLPRDFRFSPTQGPHGPRAPWGGEIGGAGVDHFGSPGTAPTQKMAHLEHQDDLTSLEADNIRVVYKYIGDLINLQKSKSQERNLDIAKFISLSLSGTVGCSKIQELSSIHHSLTDIPKPPLNQLAFDAQS